MAKAGSIKRRAATGRALTGQRFERLFSQLSSAFAKVPDAEVDAAIESCLRRLVTFLGVDHGGVSQVLTDGRAIQLTHSYGVRDAASRPSTVLRADYPWFAEQIRSGKIIRCERVRTNLPSEASAESRYVRKTGLKSLLMLPLNMAGESLGALAFGSVRRYRRWPDALVRRLQLVAQVLGNALARKRARERLEKRLTFERLITKLVGTFIDVEASRVDEHVREGLGRLVEYLGVDDISLSQMSEEGTLAVTCRVTRGSVSRESPIVTSPSYVEALHGRHIVVVNSPHEVVFVDLEGADATAMSRRGSPDPSRSSSSTPSRMAFDHRLDVELRGVRSQVSIPLMAEDRLWGIITAALDRVREWTVWEMQQLRLVGEIMMEVVVRREIEEKARRQRDELTYAAQVAALGQLTAALAHELNQPLTAIRMNAQITRRQLVAGCDFEELNEIFADIAADATRAAGLIVRLRNLLRRHELEKAPLDLNQVIEDARPIADAEAYRHGARLVLALASGLPTVRGDAMQLQQVLLNLVRNAAEAMADGVPDPRVVVQTCATPTEHVTVSIEDTGPRIDDPTFDGMFVAFHTTKPDGLGMGLAISQSIIEAHGGRLWAERQPETGLVVQFSLPASRDIR